MSRVAIVVGAGFEDSEFDSPRRALLDAGHDVDVVGSRKGEELTGKKGRVSTVVELAGSDADPAVYDGLVIPGGHGPDHLRTDEDVVRFVRAVAGRGVPVAAICHAGSLLVEADLVNGRRLTSWPSIRTDLVNAGAEWVDEEVVVDGNLVTSRNPGDLPAFCDTLLAALGSGDRR